ncbi:hypothetical protein D0T49_02435 [Paludibacter sp. 221]|uniref:hypothetical protein n=1 Tax=Paludibacter sp. 221 TaxID=2302939 RepID=UPI0013D0C5E7|nr:hypothetical protein [Paludibacter sp. 221]NDV45904.1 hypothetical protein [Paludibacter sp. 221]
MNNIFSIKRFWFVTKKNFLENWKQYSVQALTMFGIMFVIFLSISFDHYKDLEQGYAHDTEILLLAWSSILFLIFGIFTASTFMEPMRNKTKRIAYLINPSSNLEKFLSRWLIVSVGYVIMFFVCLWLADMLRVAILSIRFPQFDIPMLDFGRMMPTEGKNNISFVFFSRSFFSMWVGVYTLTQSLFILGATFWEKATFVKTFSAGIIIWGALIMLCRWTIMAFYNGDFSQFGNVLDSFSMNRIEESTGFTIITCILLFFTLANWTISFFRFRESEIIKRL